MIPEIGSEWIARDGRKMRVIRIIEPGAWQDCPRALLSVLNPGHRMRGFTEIATSSFGPSVGNSFLKPLPSEDQRHD